MWREDKGLRRVSPNLRVLHLTRMTILFDRGSISRETKSNVDTCCLKGQRRCHTTVRVHGLRTEALPLEDGWAPAIATSCAPNLSKT